MPLSIWNWQDSLRAVMSDKAYVVSEFEDIRIRYVSHISHCTSCILCVQYISMSIHNFEHSTLAYVQRVCVHPLLLHCALTTCHALRSVSNIYMLPSVIVLKQYSARPDKIPVMSRRNVYYRDNFACQVLTKLT